MRAVAQAARLNSRCSGAEYYKALARRALGIDAQEIFRNQNADSLLRATRKKKVITQCARRSGHRGSRRVRINSLYKVKILADGRGRDFAQFFYHRFSHSREDGRKGRAVVGAKGRDESRGMRRRENEIGPHEEK